MADITSYLNQILSAVYGKDVRQAIHDAIHQCYEDGKAGELDLVAREGVEDVKSNIANPNLLINGDFRINQRGKTTYTGTSNARTYTADRWWLFGNATCEVNNNYLTLTSTSTSQGIAQAFEENLSVGESYVLTAKINGEVETLEIVGGTSKKGNHLFYTVADSGFAYDRVGVYGSNGVDVISWVKLEKGTIATPIAPRPYAEELTMCQRFYKEVLVTGLPVNYYTSDYAYVEASILLEQKMRAVCNAYFKSTDITIGFRCANDTTPSGSVDKDNIIATNQRIILKGTCTKMPISVWTKDSDILCLDAEIY